MKQQHLNMGIWDFSKENKSSFPQVSCQEKRSTAKDNLRAQTPEQALGHHCALVKTSTTRVRGIGNVRCNASFLATIFANILCRKPITPCWMDECLIYGLQ